MSLYDNKYDEKDELRRFQYRPEVSYCKFRSMPHCRRVPLLLADSEVLVSFVKVDRWKNGRWRHLCYAFRFVFVSRLQNHCFPRNPHQQTHLLQNLLIAALIVEYARQSLRFI